MEIVGKTTEKKKGKKGERKGKSGREWISEEWQNSGFIRTKLLLL